MNRKFIFVGLLFSSCIIYAAGTGPNTAVNSVKTSGEAITAQVYAEGGRRFPPGKDVFKAVTFYDPNAGLAELAKAQADVNKYFSPDCVGALLKTRDNKWSATVKINDPKYSRKTIIDRELLTLGGSSYLVIVSERGIKVIDRKTNIEVKIDKVEKRK